MLNQDIKLANIRHWHGKNLWTGRKWFITSILHRVTNYFFLMYYGLPTVPFSCRTRAVIVDCKITFQLTISYNSQKHDKNSPLEDANYEYTFIIYSTGWCVRLCIKVKQCELQTVNFYCLYVTHTAYKDGRFVLQHEPQWTQVSSQWEASSFHITLICCVIMCEGSSDTCLNITNVYGALAEVLHKSSSK